MQHETINKYTPYKVLFYWLLAGGLEWSFYMSLGHNTPDTNYIEKLSAISQHVLAAVIMFFSLPKRKGWFHYERLWARMFFFFILFFPILGWFFSILLFFSYKKPDKIKELFLEDDILMNSNLMDSGEILHEEELTKNEKIYRELDFVPLVDILESDDLDLKRGAIEKLGNLSTPEAISILKKYRSDSSPEVRFFITSTLTKSKKNFEEQIESAKQYLKQDVFNVKAQLQLARIYTQFIKSNLLDVTTSKIYKNEALFHLQELILKHNYIEEECFWLLIDIYEKDKEWQEASDVLLLMKKRGVGFLQDILKKEVNILFNSGRYIEIKKALSELTSLHSVDEKWMGLAKFWGVKL